MKTIILLLLLSANSFAQDAVALLRNPDGSSGSCVLLERVRKTDDGNGWVGLAVTAAHVIKGVPTFQVVYGKRSGSGCVSVLVDEEADLAIVRVWAPDDVEPVEIHIGDIEGEVEVVGYPLGERGRTEGRFLRRLGKNIFADSVVMPGYSGGGAFFRGKLVGCVSGGWMWMKEDGKSVTWPTRAGSYIEIKRMLEEARAK
jgi:hypothetical protein